MTRAGQPASEQAEEMQMLNLYVCRGRGGWRMGRGTRSEYLKNFWDLQAK